jgi:hypothetical protein
VNLQQHEETALRGVLTNLSVSTIVNRILSDPAGRTVMRRLFLNEIEERLSRKRPQ